MRRSAGHFVHSIKDAIRTVRYAVRVEADAPGASLPKTVGNIDLAPFVAVGSTVGTPALRAIDGLLSQVETIATEVTRPRPHDRPPATYPAPISAFHDTAGLFSDLLYPVYKRMLQGRGVKNVLLSEQAFDDAEAAFRARHGDLRRATGAGASAGLTCALAAARPIRKIDFGAAAAGRELMLAPNIHCAAVVGLTVALVTREPSLADDPEGLADSVRSVVDARFDRFKRAMAGKSPAADLAAQFDAVLPFLP